ncbi:MAG: helix-turn-helix domain-containing protein [Bacteroidales bacterium]|nr:helix-turn-helix domain-containing protein [Bacteroidales bacterium]
MPNIRKAYKFRLKTNRDIENKLSRFCGSARFLWNKSLAMNLERLEKAFGDCFDKHQPLKRMPVFKKKGSGDGIRFPQGLRFVNQMIM